MVTAFAILAMFYWHKHFLSNLQMSTESQESCPSTQSIWFLTRKAICLLLLLSPSALTRGTTTFLDMKDPSLTTWQYVTSLGQPSLKVRVATHLTLQSWWRNQQNQAKLMDFSFCWIPTLINKTTLKRMSRAWIKETNLLNYTSIHLHNTLHLDLDLMEWVPWKEWPEQKAFSNFLTTRRSALSTTERNARLGSTWN